MVENKCNTASYKLGELLIINMQLIIRMMNFKNKKGQRTMGMKRRGFNPVLGLREDFNL